MIDVLSVVLGRNRATSVVNDLQDYIQAQAEVGARAGAREEVKPYVIASLIMGGLGVVFGGWALYRTTRK